MSHGIWLFRTRKLRAAAKATGRDVDEFPESGLYPVDAAEKGSIASSRDGERDAIPERASVALARVLELGTKARTSVPQLVKGDNGNNFDAKTAVDVRCEEVPADGSEGVQGTDYGTIERSPAASRTRPGFKRQDTMPTCPRNSRW